MIEIKGVSKIYSSNSGNVVALDNINLKFPDTGLFTIMGETGCGKSTLMNIIGTFDKPTVGEVIIDNTPISSFSLKMYDNYRCNYLSCIFQNISIFDLIPDLTVIENIDLAFFLQNRKINEKRVFEILELLKIKEICNKKTINLSGGQIQRASTVRAISRNTKIIIADEPTSSLDPETKEIIINFFKELSKKKLIIVVSHDPSILSKVDGAVILNNGKLVSFKNKEQLEKNELFNRLKNENKENENFFKSLYEDDNKGNDISEEKEKEKKIKEIVENINNEIKKDNLKLFIPFNYVLKIIFNNIKNKKISIIVQIIVHFFIFLTLSSLAISIFYFLKNMPEIKKEKAIDFENESIKLIIHIIKIIFLIISIFAVFISARSVLAIMKNNREKIGILRSIGSSLFSIFIIYFIETIMILSLSFLISLTLQFFYFNTYLSLIENMEIILIMFVYLISMSFLSVLIPIIFFLKKSIVNMLKKDK